MDACALPSIPPAGWCSPPILSYGSGPSTKPTRQATKSSICRAALTSFSCAAPQTVWRCGVSPRLISRCCRHFRREPIWPARSKMHTPSIPPSTWVKRCGASSVSVSSPEYKLPTHRLPENRCHERLAETDRCPRRAGPAPRSLPVAAAAGYPLLRRVAVLEVRLAEGDVLEYHARPVQERIPRPRATPRNRRGNRRFRRVVLPCTLVSGPLRTRRRPRGVLRERHGRHLVSPGPACGRVRGGPRAACPLGFHASSSYGLRPR